VDGVSSSFAATLSAWSSASLVNVVGNPADEEGDEDEHGAMACAKNRIGAPAGVEPATSPAVRVRLLPKEV
jgi:hypothetical protein